MPIYHSPEVMYLADVSVTYSEVIFRSDNSLIDYIAISGSIDRNVLE